MLFYPAARNGPREHNDIRWRVYRPAQHVCADHLLPKGLPAGVSRVNECQQGCRPYDTDHVTKRVGVRRIVCPCEICPSEIFTDSIYFIVN